MIKFTQIRAFPEKPFKSLKNNSAHMRIRRKEQAKAYVEALGLNAVSIDDIVKWADSIILEDDEPSIEVIELAGCSKGSDAISCLNMLSLGANEELSIRILFGLLHKALLCGDSDYSVVAKRLYFWSMYETKLENFGELVSFWDAIDLADFSNYGDPTVVRNEMIEFLYENKA